MRRGLGPLIAKILIGLVAFALVLVITEMVASESGEVVVLVTQNEAAERVETRLWVAEYGGNQFLRSSPGSGWYARVQAQEFIRVQRDGVTKRYIATSEPDLLEDINEAMATKYGWADKYISVFADRSSAIAIRLTPYRPSGLADD